MAPSTPTHHDHAAQQRMPPRITGPLPECLEAPALAVLRRVFEDAGPDASVEATRATLTGLARQVARATAAACAACAERGRASACPWCRLSDQQSVDGQ